MALIDWLALILIVGLPAIFIILIVLQHLLGTFLSKKYDPHFFKQPYFTVGELTVYSAWPLNLIKMATYILFTAYPWTLQKRRFKDQLSPYSPSGLIKLCSQLWVFALLFSLLSVPIILIFMFTLPR